MSTLPTGLPGCGQPATIRFEIYSRTPTGGVYGSLDGSLYVCEGHADEALSAIRVAGLTPYTVNGPGKRCGDGYDFTGDQPGALHAPEPVSTATTAVQISAPTVTAVTDVTGPRPEWVERAYNVVGTFNPTSRTDAARLLDGWAHRAELTDAERHAVMDLFAFHLGDSGEPTPTVVTPVGEPAGEPCPPWCDGTDHGHDYAQNIHYVEIGEVLAGPFLVFVALMQKPGQPGQVTVMNDRDSVWIDMTTEKAIILRDLLTEALGRLGGQA
jgi:hypothetical protein